MSSNGLVVVERGMVTFLDALRSYFAGNLSMGLHQSQNEPQRYWTLAQIQPAVFSGYAGLIPIVTWSAALMSGEKAVTRAALLQWTHNGGPNQGFVCGYYVVDSSGKLVWVQRQDPPFAAMISAGQTYTVRPAFSGGSWFPV